MAKVAPPAVKRATWKSAPRGLTGIYRSRLGAKVLTPRDVLKVHEAWEGHFTAIWKDLERQLRNGALDPMTAASHLAQASAHHCDVMRSQVEELCQRAIRRPSA